MCSLVFLCWALSPRRLWSGENCLCLLQHTSKRSLLRKGRVLREPADCLPIMHCCLLDRTIFREIYSAVDKDKTFCLTKTHNIFIYADTCWCNFTKLSHHVKKVPKILFSYAKSKKMKIIWSKICHIRDSSTIFKHVKHLWNTVFASLMCRQEHIS